MFTCHSWVEWQGPSLGPEGMSAVFSSFVRTPLGEGRRKMGSRKDVLKSARTKNKLYLHKLFGDVARQLEFIPFLFNPFGRMLHVKIDALCPDKDWMVVEELTHALRRLNVDVEVYRTPSNNFWTEFIQLHKLGAKKKRKKAKKTKKPKQRPKRK
jgi:hypothetical protein